MTYGRASSSTSKVATALIDASKARDKQWEADHTGDQAMMVWASDAGKCTRQIGYRLLGHEAEPMDDHGRHVVQIGNALHEHIQEHLSDMENEVRFHGKEDGDEEPWIRGRVDLDDGEIAYDIKTAGTVKMKSAMKEGADVAHLLQAAIGAKFLGRRHARVVYIGKERMWKNIAHGLGLDPDALELVAQEYELDLENEDDAELLEWELERLRKIWEFAQDGILPPRFIPFLMPTGARVTDPSTGAWTLFEQQEDPTGELGSAAWFPVKTGKAWSCRYCSYQEQCSADLVPADGPVEATADPIAPKALEGGDES